jgi:3-dehydroquinate synthase
MSQNLIFTNKVSEAIAEQVKLHNPDRVFILVDENTERLVLPRIDVAPLHATVITIKAGDEHKTLDAVSSVWGAMTGGGATRRSLLINIGGGMVTDLGGFAAASFKRGIRFVNVATTLLGAVDAAVGGKTGINFMGYKNEIGVFCEADSVIISTCFFSTLPPRELVSGFAEMLKHGLISGGDVYASLLNYDIVSAPLDELLPLLEQSVEVKRQVVAQDPREQGLRKALNLGHTAGHAFESLAMERRKPMPHGCAVAHGLLVEMIISHFRCGFPSDVMHRYAQLLREAYAPAPEITCDDYPQLLALMHHDKKNHSAAEINFTLLEAPGKVKLDQNVEESEISSALDIYRDLVGQ